MSGNSTRLGVSLAEGAVAAGRQALGLIALFVAGAAAGSLIVLGRGAERQPWLLPDRSRAACRGRALPCLRPVEPRDRGIVLAMGLENAVFQIDGGAGLGLTYVTGALVKVGQLLAVSLTGGPRWSWVPNLLLWAALVAGSAAGALAYAWINLAAIWFAAGAALALAAIIAAAMRRSRA